jgi:flagellar basal-body rod protein FlgB
MEFLNKVFGVHEPALQVRARRLEVLSQNIANADTPSYRARDVDFRAALAEAGNQQTALVATQTAHFASGEDPAAADLRYRVPFNTAFDGNTVEISVEQAHYGKAAADYQATLNFLENRVSGLRKALRGE